MTKLLMVIALIYIVYYTANIVYDLFLKKPDKPAEAPLEVYSIIDSDHNDVKNVNIDDVENLYTPGSFNTKQTVESSEPVQVDTEYWRKKFEEESNIDAFANMPKPEPDYQEQERNDSAMWQNLLNMAETKIQMVSNTEGYKVYTTLL